MSEAASAFRQRVIQAAENALAQNEFVSLADVFLYLRFPSPSSLQRWLTTREPYLEPLIQAGHQKIAWTKAVFREWAARRGLRAHEAPRLARTIVPERDLRFTVGQDAEAETAHRQYYFPSELSESKRRKLLERLSAPPEIVVFSIVKNSQCVRCKEPVFKGRLLVMEGEQPLCLRCAGMDDLVFLAA
jgi:hypothetical protein